jgi:hypothetical protein
VQIVQCRRCESRIEQNTCLLGGAIIGAEAFVFAVVLRRVETMLERVLETPVRRLFRSRIQPMEIAVAIGRAMEQQAQVAPAGLQVPNRYFVSLHPQDFAAFATWHRALEQDLGAHVQRRALERNWQCPGRPLVELRSSLSVNRGRIAVEVATVDAPAAAAESDPAGTTLPASGGTAVLSAVAAPSPPLGQAPWLEMGDGSRRVLGKPIIRIGRGLDNDVVIADATVSRHHAQICQRGPDLVLVDLGSLNGTRVDGEPVRERALRPGDTLHVGSVPMRFHAN